MTVQLEPTVFVLFGATGDLVNLKIAPALFHLLRKQVLPVKFSVVGFGRRDLSHEAWRANIRAAVAPHLREGESALLEEFLRMFFYVRGQLDAVADYVELTKAIGAMGFDEWNRLLYLAVPPDLYEPILKHAAASGLSKPTQGWARLLVEKPLGTDGATSEALDRLLGELYEEKQIYRIEHYLAKHMVQNMLTFRFSNSLFESIWNAEHIESIHIRLWEEIGVEHRGAFYDALGTLRDVGQNHLLQMLALVTMEKPVDFTADAIRAARADLLNSLVPMSLEEIQTQTFRAQYDGYAAIAGVAVDTQTETYFKILTHIPTARWQGVPVILESGKRMERVRKEMVVTFKGGKNRMTFSLAPREAITLEFFAKKPQHAYEVEKRTMDFTLRDGGTSQYVEEYEKVVLEGLRGDQTLFVSTPELKAMWRVIDPIVAGWKAGAVGLSRYSRQTDEADVASRGLEAGE